MNSAIMLVDTKEYIMKSIYYTAALSLFLFACNSSELAQKESENKNEGIEEISVIQPLDIDPGASVYRVSADFADTIYTPAGSSIIFDANSFVDANGKPIKGNVDVEWQEFHTLADIVASGIPMKYDSAGVAYDFQSGGMFTIDAKKDGEPIEMAPGKSAQVNLASIQDTPCYNFYKLDEKSGDWDYKTTKNGQKIETSEKQTDLEDTMPETIIDVQLSTAAFPELNANDIIGWKCTDKINSMTKYWLESASTKVRLSEKTDGGYYLEAKDNGAVRKFKVQPYSRREALQDSKQNSAELAQQTNEVLEYAKKVSQNKQVRSIEIKGFGTYNWDIINKRRDRKQLFASFEYPNGVDGELVALRLISPDENIVVSFNSVKDDKFSFAPSKRNILVGVTASSELVVAKDNAFDSARRKGNRAKHTFRLKKTGIKLKAPSDIMKYLNQLI